MMHGEGPACTGCMRSCDACAQGSAAALLHVDLGKGGFMRKDNAQADREQGLNTLFQGAGSGPAGVMAAFGAWWSHHAEQETAVSADAESHADSTSGDQIRTMQLVVGAILSPLDPK